MALDQARGLHYHTIDTFSLATTKSMGYGIIAVHDYGNPTIPMSLQKEQKAEESTSYGQDLRSDSARYWQHPRHGARQCPSAQPGTRTNLLCGRAGVHTGSLHDGRP